jgi:DNA-binding XRE family transcriptional regulator
MEHPLRKFRRDNAMTLDGLASAIGVTKGYLSKIETRDQLPSMDLAQRIFEVTSGAVTPNDFIKTEETGASS